MSTFAPRCYTGQDVFQGMIDFYNTTINLSHKYDIYKALERHGIVPGDSHTTALIQKVIEKEFGMIPDLRCNDKGHLEETWIYFHMKVREKGEGG
jgi:ribonuclease T2